MSLTSRKTVGRYKPEEIVAKLRQVDVLVSQGQNMVVPVRATRRRGAPVPHTVGASACPGRAAD
jgi:hypothetical protein